MLNKFLLLCFALLFAFSPVQAAWVRDESINEKIDVYYQYIRRGKTFADFVTFLNANLDKKYEAVFTNTVTLADNAIIPTNCVTMRFEPEGLITGNYTITFSGQNTEAPKNQQIIGYGTDARGTVNNPIIYPEWFGALGDNSHDDTGAIRKAIEFSSEIGIEKWQEIRFTGNKNYKITDVINITNSKLRPGWHISGDNWNSTYITQHTNNTGIFELNTQLCHSGTLEKLTLTYPTTQVSEDAKAIRLSGTFDCEFKDLRIRRAFHGIYSDSGLGGTSFANIFKRVYMDFITGYGIYLTSLSGGGPINRFEQIRILGNTVTNNYAAIAGKGSASLDSIEVLGWENKVFGWGTGNGVIFNNVNIEALTITSALPKVFDLNDGVYIIDGIRVGLSADISTTTYLVAGNSGASISLDGVVSADTGGAFPVSLSAFNNSGPNSYVRNITGIAYYTEPQYSVYLTKSSAQSIPSGTDTFLTLQTEVYDYQGMFDTGASAITINILEDGFYEIDGSVTFDTTVDNYAELKFYHNNTSGVRLRTSGSSKIPADGANSFKVNCSAIDYFEAGESVTCLVRHGTGTDQDVLTTDTNIKVTRVGRPK